ncbi:MAG: hypothetical protein M4579_000146 [Chaenotheca gracillima]|nr:MAG: hypothetical protein M4579_000146 [Chaenotheca gracillima]
MAFSSYFRGSSVNPLLPQYEHELPLLGSGVVPPPPVIPTLADSTLPASSMSRQRTRGGRAETSQPQLLVLQREERQIQKDLQLLLDAQSEGLISGLTGKDAADSWSESSSTRSTSMTSARARQLSPSGQHAEKPLGLRRARRGILAAMQELAAVKAEELDVLESEDHSVKAVLNTLAGWASKKEGLQRELGRIETSEAGARLRRLEGEEGAVKREIHDLETRLYELKAKHRHLSSEISQLQNSLQAKESSYKASLSLLESDIKKFLTNPPLEPSHSPVAPSNTTSFFDLNPKRRTPELAEEYFSSEREAMKRSREQVSLERDALEDGCVVWSDVVLEVTAFERLLRIEMRKLSSPNTPKVEAYQARSSSPGSARGSNKSPLSPPADQGLPMLLTQMSKIIDLITSKLAIAEAKDWNLLVCCIGAELEAFKEGKDILTAALGQAGHVESQAVQHRKSRSTTAPSTSLASPVIPRSFDGASSSGANRPSGQPTTGEREERQASIETDGDVEYRDAVERSSDDEDDSEPHPDLLVSRPDES